MISGVSGIAASSPAKALHSSIESSGAASLPDSSRPVMTDEEPPEGVFGDRVRKLWKRQLQDIRICKLREEMVDSRWCVYFRRSVAVRVPVPEDMLIEGENINCSCHRVGIVCGNNTVKLTTHPTSPIFSLIKFILRRIVLEAWWFGSVLSQSKRDMVYSTCYTCQCRLKGCCVL